MAKPGDHSDSTQQLSESQVVAVTPKPPPHGIAPGDQSVMWRGTVVSADDFATAPAKKSRAKWVVAGVLGVGAIGAGGYAMWPSSSSGASTSGSGSAEQAPPPAPAPAPPPAAVPAPPPPADAAPPPEAPADAVTADAAAEPAATAPAKPPAKKPPPKKKPPAKKKPTH
jgi:hypothetical protein